MLIIIIEKKIETFFVTHKCKIKFIMKGNQKKKRKKLKHIFLLNLHISIACITFTYYIIQNLI